MGRFSSVQAYADNNTNVRKVSYEQVTGGGGGGDNSRGVVKPEKVINAYGSTAGAGSGEFHVYRHARAREMERLCTLEELDMEQKKEQEYQNMIQHNKIEEELRTAKRRKKRQREKAAKQRKKNLQQVGISTVQTTGDDDDDDMNEFNSIPTIEQKLQQKQQPSCSLPTETTEKFSLSRTTNNNASYPITVPFTIPNDGSFLETIQKKLAQQSQTIPVTDDCSIDKHDNRTTPSSATCADDIDEKPLPKLSDKV